MYVIPSTLPYSSTHSELRESVISSFVAICHNLSETLLKYKSLYTPTAILMLNKQTHGLTRSTKVQHVFPLSVRPRNQLHVPIYSSSFIMNVSCAFYFLSFSWSPILYLSFFQASNIIFCSKYYVMYFS